MIRETKRKTMIALPALACAVAMLVGGCATNAQSGATIGALLGAAAGNWIGDDTEGTLIGAGVGAAAGYMIGNEADKQEAQEIEEDAPR